MSVTGTEAAEPLGGRAAIRSASQLTERLAEEETLFTLLGRAIYGMPDRALFAAMADERVFETVPFVSTEPKTAEVEDGLARTEQVRLAQTDLLAWTDGCARPFSDEDFEQVRVDYARLFVGAQKVAAPLWESVYFNRERMVFQQQTLDVRMAYRAYGLEVESYGHEPDDHLASELLFVAHLASVARAALEAGDADRARVALADQRAFAHEHLLTWVGAWRDLVIARCSGPAANPTPGTAEGRTGFYRGFARLTAAACEEARAFAEEARALV